jgi:glycosyltransferase involved in cell wall biosynthesis
MWVREGSALVPQSYRVVSDVIARAASEPAQGTREEALDAIAAALRSSVAAHLVSDVPVGLFLSGGMDSTLLASLLGRTENRPRSVTLGFHEYKGTALDESVLAAEVAALTGAEHRSVHVGRDDFAAEREALLSAMDQPSIDGINTWFVARAAAATGMKVAISGLGGDELFASYPSFRQVPRLARAMAAPARLPGLGVALRRIASPLLRNVTSPKYAGLVEYGGSVAGAYLLRRALFMPWELPQVMDHDMAREGLRQLDALAMLRGTIDRVDEHAPPRLKVSALEMSWYTRHQLLADADWASMAHSLEVRVPLADIDLLEAVAPWFASHPDITKREVVARVATQLPKQVLDRPKTGFSVPVRDWMGAPRSARGLRGWAQYVHGRFAREPAPAANDSRPRVLVATLAPGPGGVDAMAEFAVRTLTERGLQPVLAYYATYGAMPELSVPATRLLQRKPAMQTAQAYGGHDIHAVGAWLPELEFTHFAPTAHWRKLMDSCSACVVASGNVLPATPFLLTGRPYLAWVATDWDGDRKDRVRRFPLLRRALDTCVNSPIIRRLEKRLLRGGRVLPLSEYTREMLEARAGGSIEGATLPVPVDVALFKPAPGARVAGRIGFAGRFNDPRKNIGLLLQAAVRLRELGCEFTVLLMGDAPNAHVRGLVEQLDLGTQVTFRQGLSRLEMRDCMQTLDVFVLPSHQEGLCISALEAMACGVPVVSTRCGGPEEFVLPGVTGELVASEPRAMAAAVMGLLREPERRQQMSIAGRELVRDRYSRHRAEAIFVRELEAAFPGLLPATIAAELYVETA